MRGKVRVHETIRRHQIPLDDTEEQDVLSYLPATIAFIQNSLASGDGVLIHCMAGMSRSATIAAAYLMYSQGLDPKAALELIREVRPVIQPNPAFLHQLEIFHAAFCKVTKRDKNIREYYLSRAANQVVNGDGEPPEMNMFASFPRTPTASAPATPGGPRRRIRCKMCRCELATREHMMDHSQQAGPTTPVSVNGSATVSRRPSIGEATAVANGLNGLQLTSMSPAGSRRPSMSHRGPVRRSSLNQSMTPGGGPGGILGSGLAMSTISAAPATVPALVDDSNGYIAHPDRRPSIIAAEAIKKLGALAMTKVHEDDDDNDYAIEDDDDDDDDDDEEEEEKDKDKQTPSGPITGAGRGSHGARTGATVGGVAARRGKPHRIALPGLRKEPELPRTPADEVTPGIDASRAIDPSVAQAVVQEQEMQLELSNPTSPAYQQPADLHTSLPAKLAALRRPSVAQAFKSSGLSGMTPLSGSPAPSPPILLYNSKCSGYFVEPLKWMQPFLEKGQIAGKIICPNPKCGAKLGNYDWAGVACGCKEWVTPGFCIHKSKVDEIS
ncbi:Dual specificity phosphatase, catalytic domain [Ceratobasidium sp. AG-Ba]|nr:Dual specificity phosphatase, catalytic domain [Ceratobasidium sp. AG-Ba]